MQQFSYEFLSEGNHQSNQYTKDSWPVIDVRHIRDNPSFGTSSLEDYLEMIDLAWETMRKYGRVVICCVAGRSRSNAIAIGLLVRHLDMSFDDAWKLVYEKVPDARIKEHHIAPLKQVPRVTHQL